MSWVKRTDKTDLGGDKALNILARSHAAELFDLKEFAERKAAGRITLDPIDQLYNELNDYIGVCEERSSLHPNIEIGALKDITRYKANQEMSATKIKHLLKHELLKAAGLDEDAKRYFPESIRQQHLASFSEKFLGFDHQMDNLADPMLKAKDRPMSWVQMMDKRIDILAETITKKLMAGAEQIVFQSHGASI